MKNIAIALPAHNEEKSIYRTLTAINSSDFQGIPFSVYICLSACSDNTLQQINKFIEANPTTRITVLEDKVGGKVRALKLLDNAIDAELIIFMDSDCKPRPETLYKIYSGLSESDASVQVCSGNSIDTRYIDKDITSTSLIDSFNRTFWQHPPRKIINGQLFCARKGVVQIIPDEVILDDPFLTIVHWKNFIKDNTALIDQGSAQSIWDVVRYQKSIEAGKQQIQKLLGDLPDFNEITNELYSQFDIRLKDRPTLYPNISYFHLVLINALIYFGKLWGKLVRPVWHQTLSSKEIANE